jgi:hypothetical protein
MTQTFAKKVFLAHLAKKSHNFPEKIVCVDFEFSTRKYAYVVQAWTDLKKSVYASSDASTDDCADCFCSRSSVAFEN